MMADTGDSEREDGSTQEGKISAAATETKTTPTSREATPTLSRGVSRGEERNVIIPLLPYSSLRSCAMQLANPPNPSDQSANRWKPCRLSHSSTKKCSLSSSWVRNWGFGTKIWNRDDREKSYKPFHCPTHQDLRGMAQNCRLS